MSVLSVLEMVLIVLDRCPFGNVLKQPRATNLIDMFLKFIGPIAIIPSLILLSIFIVRPLLTFVVQSEPVFCFIVS